MGCAGGEQSQEKLARVLVSVGGGAASGLALLLAQGQASASLGLHQDAAQSYHLARCRRVTHVSALLWPNRFTPGSRLNMISIFNNQKYRFESALPKYTKLLFEFYCFMKWEKKTISRSCMVLQWNSVA